MFEDVQSQSTAEWFGTKSSISFTPSAFNFFLIAIMTWSDFPTCGLQLYETTAYGDPITSSVLQPGKF